MVRMVKPCLIPKRGIQSLNLQSKTYLTSELNAMNFPVFWEVPLEINWPWDPWDATTQKDNSPKSTKRYTYTYIPSYSLSQRFSTHIFPQQNGRFPNKTGLTLAPKRTRRQVHPSLRVPRTFKRFAGEPSEGFGVSINGWYPAGWIWMVYFMEPPTLKWMRTGGTPHFRTSPKLSYVITICNK